MALADLVVLMNNGRIEQKGTPREVFNAPRTEFVARFIGGHNIVVQDGQMVAVRNDHLTLSAPVTPVENPHLDALITQIEYQGTHVRVSLATATGSELTSDLTDEHFDNFPLSVGQAVTASWDRKRATVLTTTS